MWTLFWDVPWAEDPVVFYWDVKKGVYYESSLAPIYYLFNDADFGLSWGILSWLILNKMRKVLNSVALS